MWTMTKRGFYSVVAHRDDPSRVLVRARCDRDIRALELIVSTRGDTETDAEAQKKKGAMQAMADVAARRSRAKRPQKDKEILTVHLATAVRVETVLSDRGYVEAWKGAALGAITPIETEEHCRMVWQTLREHWRAGLSG